MAEHSYDDKSSGAETGIEGAALPERLKLYESTIEQHKAQTATAIRQYCEQFKQELGVIPLVALKCNLSYPMDTGSYFDNYMAYAELQLPLINLGDDFYAKHLSIDLKSAELTYLQPRRGSGPGYRFGLLQDFESRIKPATDEMVYNAANYFSWGNFEKRLDRMRETALGEHKQLNNKYPRVDIESYPDDTRALVDALTHVLSGTEPSAEEDLRIRKAVATLLGKMGSGQLSFFPEAITYGFFPGLLREDTVGPRYQPELRRSLARAIWYRTSCVPV